MSLIKKYLAVMIVYALVSFISSFLTYMSGCEFHVAMGFAFNSLAVFFVATAIFLAFYGLFELLKYLWKSN